MFFIEQIGVAALSTENIYYFFTIHIVGSKCRVSTKLI